MTSLEISTVQTRIVQKYPVEKTGGIAEIPAWTFATVCKVLHVSKNTLSGWVTKRKIPHYRQSKKSPIFFPIRELVEWDCKKNFK